MCVCVCVCVSVCVSACKCVHVCVYVCVYMHKLDVKEGQFSSKVELIWILPDYLLYTMAKEPSLSSQCAYIYVYVCVCIYICACIEP